MRKGLFVGDRALRELMRDDEARGEETALQNTAQNDLGTKTALLLCNADSHK